MAHYNQDAWRMVEQAVKALVDDSISKVVTTASADPAEGTKGQIAVVNGVVKVCTAASSGLTAATWKEVSTKS